MLFNIFETGNYFFPGYTFFEIFRLALNHFHIIMKAERQNLVSKKVGFLWQTISSYISRKNIYFFSHILAFSFSCLKIVAYVFE